MKLRDDPAAARSQKRPHFLDDILSLIYPHVQKSLTKHRGLTKATVRGGRGGGRTHWLLAVVI